MSNSVYKVGAVILRDIDTPEPKVLIVRPFPKEGGELPYTLPRGSREYRGKDGKTYDARDEATAIANADRLEPLPNTLARELHEEAGLKPEHLWKQPIFEVGPKPYTSESKGTFDIHWFAVTPSPEVIDGMQNMPGDALKPTQWKTVNELKAMGDGFRQSYLPLIESVITGVQKKQFPELDALKYQQSAPSSPRSR